jgi:NACHT domain
LLTSSSSEELAKELQDGLTAHYRAILVFLAKVTQHYTKHTAVRIIQSVVPDFDALQSTYESIVSTQASLDRLCALVSGENIQALSGSLTRLRLEQAEEHGKLHDKLERLLWTLLTPINRLDFGMNSLHDNLDRQTKSKILRAISTQPYGAHQKAVAKDRLPGSGQWLLELQSYQDWRTESSPSVLWLHGMPGCGKSKLVSLVVEDVQKADRVAFFYCMRNPAEPQRAECDKILASLVRQLACPSAAQPILPPVLRQYEAAVEGFGEFEDQIWSIEESTRILIELSNIYPSVTLVIDALDEVNQAERPEVLSALDEIMAKSDNLVKVFIASRDNIDIWLRLNSSPNVYIDVEHNKKDIAQFMWVLPYQSDSLKLH